MPSADDRTKTAARDARPGAASSLVVSAPGRYQTYALNDGAELTIGRRKTADVPIEHETVSGTHAVLRVREGAFSIEDESKNGTEVRGTRIERGRAVDVGVGEAIAIGPAVLMITRDAAWTVPGLPHPATSFRRELDQRIAALAPTNIPILILGESGVGKERVARQIHHASARSGGELVAVNVAALPESTIEADLFGSVPGAFTGAMNRAGFFEAAKEATLFLDEIGELNLPIQVKLLRVLQEMELFRVGSVKRVPVDFRLITATNADLGRRVADGTFRADLYYRLAGAMLAVPPLRDRKDEILVLAEEFADLKWRQILREQKKSAAASRPPAIAADAVEALLAHDWPGNVRELESVIFQGVALALHRGSAIELRDLLPALTRTTPAPSSTERTPSRPRPSGKFSVPRAELSRLLLEYGGNQARVARELNTSRPTISRLVKEYGLAHPRSYRT